MSQTAHGLGAGVTVSRTKTSAPFEACRGCKLRGAELCRIIQNEPAFGNRLPILRRFSRGSQIFEQGCKSGLLGVVRRGYARKSVIKVSGKRTLLGLGAPGDFVGGLPEQGHDYDFEAATDVEICSYDSATIKGQLETNQSFRRLMLQEIEHQHHRLLGLLWRNGSLTSRERICGFLIQSAEFMPTERLSDGSLVLSMEIDRSDWADLTNTTVETISRTMRYLEEKKMVTRLTPYQFRIHDLDALATLSGVEPPAGFVGESNRSKRDGSLRWLLESDNRMTAVNAQARGANRLNTDKKPVSVQKRGIAKRRPEDVQEEIRD